MGSSSEPEQAKASTGPRQDLIAGCVIVATAAMALWLGWNLPIGSLDGVGPGLAPRSIAVLLGLLGVALAISSLLQPGEPFGGIAWRGLAFVLAAIVVFALTVRPLGLAIAAPLAILVSVFATNESRWSEIALFIPAMTAFCIGLFKYALNLPIPLAPWLLGY